MPSCAAGTLRQGRPPRTHGLYRPSVGTVLDDVRIDLALTGAGGSPGFGSGGFVPEPRRRLRTRSDLKGTTLTTACGPIAGRPSAVRRSAATVGWETPAPLPSSIRSRVMRRRSSAGPQQLGVGAWPGPVGVRGQDLVGGAAGGRDEGYVPEAGIDQPERAGEIEQAVEQRAGQMPVRKGTFVAERARTDQS